MTDENELMKTSDFPIYKYEPEKPKFKLPKLCLWCGKECLHGNRFCSDRCARQYYQKFGEPKP